MRLLIGSVFALGMGSGACFGQVTDLMLVKAFAENYAPNRDSPAQLENVPAEVALAFEKLGNSDQSSCEKYLALVFVKLYRSHLECCNQSYELRTKPSSGIDKAADPLLFVFNSITKKFDASKPIEFISSGMPYEWVKVRSYLLNDAAIKKEVAIIKVKQTEILKGKI
jgi:hypothetical protein